MKKLIFIPIVLSLLFPSLAAAEALPKLTATPSYKALAKNVGALEARKGSASTAVKIQLSGRLSALHSAAAKEVAARFKIRRQEARKTNRANLARETKTTEATFNAQIKSVVSNYKIELVQLRSTFKEDARAIREEWAPRLKSLKNKITRAKQYIAGQALKKFKKRINRKIKNVVNAREDRVNDIRDIYQAERQSIIADRTIEVLEIRDEMRQAKTEVKQKYDGFWITKTSSLRAQRDAEKKKIDDLRSRGQNAIQKL